jgi:hypothetical protein
VAPSDKTRGNQEYDDDSWTPVRIQIVRNVAVTLELWEHLTAIIALTLMIIINELQRMSADRKSFVITDVRNSNDSHVTRSTEHAAHAVLKRRRRSQSTDTDAASWNARGANILREQCV